MAALSRGHWISLATLAGKSPQHRGMLCISRVALPQLVVTRTKASPSPPPPRDECEIRNPDGSVVFAAEGVEVPAEWSQVACVILAQKYLRKAGVPTILTPVEEPNIPEWLWRRTADSDKLALVPKDERSGGETSAKQCFDRLAGTWTYWGWKGGYFDAEEDARAYFDELRFMLASQMGAPNSPQWFNTGLHWAYGIDGPAQGSFLAALGDYKTGKIKASESAYEHPQPHACFIQSVADDLVNEGGIMDLWVREARLFKYGSGTGSNSRLRGDGERLSGGGRSSGLMSFLKIGDRAAGGIESCGTTRRAAKMVIVDTDHPDIEDLHRLEGHRGAEGRRARCRLKAVREAPQSGHGGLPRRRGRPARPGEEPGAEARDPRGASGDAPESIIQGRSSSRARGTRRSTSVPMTPIGIPRRTSPSPGRIPTTRYASPTNSSTPSRRAPTGN